jgi:isopentenyl diphosphate isomerase/L-lactate dehydrogenase-like FMN-dependent dehydrogenase
MNKPPTCPKALGDVARLVRKEDIQSVADAKFLAERRLPRSIFQAIEGGSGPGATMRANARAFEHTTFRPHAGRWHPEVDLRTRVAGVELSLPVLTAPTANLRLFHRDGERGVARATGDAGTVMCVSSGTGTPIEDVVAAGTGPIFFQLYYLRDRSTAEFSIERAREAGCKALLVTMDAAGQVPTERPLRERSQFPMSARLSIPDMFRFAPQAVTRFPWVFDYLRDKSVLDVPMGRTREGKSMNFLEAFMTMSSGQSPHPRWEDLSWIRRLWPGPIIVKGILCVEDAQRAVDEGASGVVVSNHAGMQCDSYPASLRMLPHIVDAVGSRIEVLLDSGIQRGIDVVKAIALGARAVLIGHAYVWPLAACGEAGVRRILDVFRAEIAQTLRSIGAPSLAALDRSYLTDHPGQDDFPR